MLDTNTISYIARNRSAGARRSFKEAAEGSSVCISAITEAEILYGLAKRPDAVRVAEMMREILKNLAILPWTSESAETYGNLRARNERAGLAVGPLDMLIAAHALSTKAVLVTSDRAFSRLLGGPAMTDWADDVRAN